MASPPELWMVVGRMPLPLLHLGEKKIIADYKDVNLFVFFIFLSSSSIKFLMKMKRPPASLLEQCEFSYFIFIMLIKS